MSAVMNHHPDHDWLEQYAAATLPSPLALVVAVHLSYCSSCRRQVEALQALGGELLVQLAPVTVADGMFERVMQRIDAAPAPSVATDAPRSEVPRPLRRLVPQGFDALSWNWALPSLRVASLDSGDGQYQLALHRISPGGRVAVHDHRGLELTQVLRGAFSDEDGVYGDGDFLLREPGQRHRPQATQNEECICLTLQAAPVRFTGPLMRLLNPLLR
jgi:putative transcriptional regulator